MSYHSVKPAGSHPEHDNPFANKSSWVKLAATGGLGFATGLGLNMFYYKQDPMGKPGMMRAAALAGSLVIGNIGADFIVPMISNATHMHNGFLRDSISMITAPALAGGSYYGIRSAISGPSPLVESLAIGAGTEVAASYAVGPLLRLVGHSDHQ